MEDDDMTMLKTLAGATGALLLGAGLASAQMMTPGWDVDGDGVLAPGEFADGLSQTAAFSALDADGDGTVTEAEYADGFAGTAYPWNEGWDLDGSGGLEAPEFAGGFFVTYDTNGSGLLESDEMAVIEADMASGGPLDI
jgi:hypothetical protein